MQRSRELGGEHILVPCGETSNFPLNRNPILCSPDPQSQSACSHVLICSVMSNSVTPRTVAHQAPLSMGFPGKNIGVDCQFLLQGIFLTQGLNSCFLHWQVHSLPFRYQGWAKLFNIIIAYPRSVFWEWHRSMKVPNTIPDTGGGP